MYLQKNCAKYTTHWESYGEYDVKNKTAFTYLRPKELYDKEPHSLNLGWKNGDKKLIELWNKVLRPIIYKNKQYKENK